MQTTPIDIVITWVDGSDPAWIAQKEKNGGPAGAQDGREVRYRDWGLLPYWFRGLERYAPWIRRVHFVTWGHVPVWLDTDCEKLHIVKHSDFIPEKYLPTFSSHPIELNMHRIPGLSECFLYANDDMFFMAPSSPFYWFRKGVPCDQATIGPYVTTFRNSIAAITSNNIEVINTRFQRKQVMRESPLNWFNPCYGKYNLFNAAGLMWPVFTGFMRSHYVNAYTRTLFETVWREEEEILDQTCLHKFRDRRDVNHWLMRYWQLASNGFVPRRQKGCQFLFTNDSPEKIRKVIADPQTRMLCINDSSDLENFESARSCIDRAFREKFPSPCSFEKKQMEE